MRYTLTLQQSGPFASAPRFAERASENQADTLGD
jgi:hypothetical protein